MEVNTIIGKFNFEHIDGVLSREIVSYSDGPLLEVSFPPTDVEVGQWQTPTSRGITGTISFATPNTLVIDGFSYDNGGVGKLCTRIMRGIFKKRAI